MRLAPSGVGRRGVSALDRVGEAGETVGFFSWGKETFSCYFFLGGKFTKLLKRKFIYVS